MAKIEWSAKDELKITLTNKHYYFEIKENENGTKRVHVREWSKSHALRPAQTREIIIFENNIKDIIKGLLKVAKRLEIDLTTIPELKGATLCH